MRIRTPEGSVDPVPPGSSRFFMTLTTEQFVANQTWEQADIATKKAVPEGLWVRCIGCGETVFGKTLEQNLDVCPKCDHHHRVSARRRVAQMVDPGNARPAYAADVRA